MSKLDTNLINPHLKFLSLGGEIPLPQASGTFFVAIHPSPPAPRHSALYYFAYCPFSRRCERLSGVAIHHTLGRVTDEPPPFLAAHFTRLHGRNWCLFPCTHADSPVTTSARDNGAPRRLSRPSEAMPPVWPWREQPDYWPTCCW